MFPVLAVLFVPIALGLEHVYVWADPPADLSAHERHVLHAKAGWLNAPGFVIRSVLYLAVFAIAAEVLRRWSRARDGVVPGADAEAEQRRFRMFAAAMLPPVGLAITFAAFDWLMSLQPSWFSSMFGVYYFAGGFGAGIAVLAILARHLYATTVPGTITPHHFHALGRLLFAFVVFWAYTSYFQGFLIQIADRPNEVTFYLVRLRGGWDLVLWAVLIAHFALPFLLLLPRRLKLRPRYVSGGRGDRPGRARARHLLAGDPGADRGGRPCTWPTSRRWSASWGRAWRSRPGASAASRSSRPAIRSSPQGLRYESPT